MEGELIQKRTQMQQFTERRGKRRAIRKIKEIGKVELKRGESWKWIEGRKYQWNAED